MVYILFYIFTEIKKKQSPLHSDSASHFFLFILPLLFYFSLINDLTAKNCHIHFRGLDLIRVDLIDILLENYEVRIFPTSMFRSRLLYRKRKLRFL